MREKNVGRLGRVTKTVTMGLTPKGPGAVKVEQSGVGALAPAEYCTVGAVTEAPPTAPRVATAMAA
jgi:hypothetical protein